MEITPTEPLVLAPVRRDIRKQEIDHELAAAYSDLYAGKHVAAAKRILDLRTTIRKSRLVGERRT